jgi:hypothetical protein
MDTTRALSVAGLAVCSAVLWMPVGVAQQGPANWLTDGADSRRTAWQQNETILTTANVKECGHQQRTEANRSRRGCVRQHLRDRRREGNASLAETFRQHI